MTRWRVVVEYDGRPFVGWQRQKNGPSIQAALEEAVWCFSREHTLVQGAGRTDAGVHALGQVAHFDIEKEFDANTVRDAINFHLKPAPISVVSAEEVSDEFHARFSAIRRLYLYRIFDRRPRPALEARRVWHVTRGLDVSAMHEAAQILVGYHDFTSFRAKDCQAGSPLRTLSRLDVRRSGNEVHIDAEGRSFLHHQVRNLAGSLRLVGEGKWTHQDVQDILVARDRSIAGPTAPAEGLYLMSVYYDTST